MRQISQIQSNEKNQEDEGMKFRDEDKTEWTMAALAMWDRGTVRRAYMEPGELKYEEEETEPVTEKRGTQVKETDRIRHIGQ